MRKFNNTEIIRQTKNWLVDIVIGFNFCPFAKRELMRDSINYLVSDSEDMNTNALDFAEELKVLEKDASVETSLIIFPKGYDDFETYLDLLDFCQFYLEENGFEGIYQLASFHPNYCFAGVKPENPENFTNKSPYPIIHIIREASIERALEHYESPESIPDTNIAMAHKQGYVVLQKILLDCYKLND